MAVATQERASPTAETEEADRLVLDHLYLVKHIANQVSARYPRHVDRGELWNAGAYGLVDASRRYDPATGIPFARYASIRIRGAIIDSTRTRDWATRGMRKDVRDTRRTADAFEHAHGREPDDTELASALGITEEALHARRTATVRTTLLHLDQPSVTGSGETTTLGEQLEELSPDLLPEEALELRELLGTLRAAVALLPDPQRHVITRYYFRGELLRDIALTLGVTEARASQIRTEALNAVRAYFGRSFDGVPEVSPTAPGVRARAVFVASVAARSCWRSRLAAADAPEPATGCAAR